MTHTYTYAVLEISQAAYDEIREKLAAAGYGKQFVTDRLRGGEIIDMHELALRALPETT